MLFTILSVVSTAVHLLGFSSRVAGQQSEVVCGSNYTWAANSLGQNPCAVASYLQGVCDAGGFDVQALPPNTHYEPPNANECECNTVVYSLISACADCQGSFYSTWADWSVNCTGAISIQSFPESIPAGTAVPAWAYLNVLTTGRYSPLAAQENTGIESSAPTHTVASTTPITVPTSSTPIVTPFTSSTAATPTKSPASAVSSSKKSNTGPIVGGVVGGLAVIAIIVGLIMIFVMRTRRSHVAPSAAYMGSMAPLATPPPMAQYPPPGPFAMQQADHSSGGMISSAPGSQHTNPFVPRPYDPADPSTFPMAMPGYHSQPSSQGQPSPTGSPDRGPQINTYQPGQRSPTVSPARGPQINTYQPGQYRGTSQV